MFPALPIDHHITSDLGLGTLACGTERMKKGIWWHSVAPTSVTGGTSAHFLGSAVGGLGSLGRRPLGQAVEVLQKEAAVARLYTLVRVLQTSYSYSWESFTIPPEPGPCG